MSIRLQIRLDSPVPAYRQLVDQLRTFLVDSTLRPDDFLPPVRTLAIELGVHFNTVAEAYRTLAAEGWLEITRGRGARVLAREAPKADQASIHEFRDRLRRMVAEMRAHGVPAARILKELREAEEGIQS